MKITGKAIPVNDEHILLEGEVRELSGADAPVAARLDACLEYPGLSLEGVIDLRIHDGRFYSRVPQTVFDGTTMDFGVRWATGAQVEDLVRTGLEDLLVIDGQLWEPTVEPALLVSRLGREIHVTHSTSLLAGNPYTPFSEPRCYRLTELDQAIAHARELREGGAETTPIIEVLIPEVFAP